MTPPSDVPIDGATAEIPFVPASLRQTAKPEVIDDSIVVVGQRQKKRKRAKKAEATDDGDGDAQKSTAVPAKAKTKTEEVVPFDFASAPNILDDGERSEQEDGRAGKRKRQKKKAQFGACGFLFPLTPRLPSGTLISGLVSSFQNAGTSPRRLRTGESSEAEMCRVHSDHDSGGKLTFFVCLKTCPISL